MNIAIVQINNSFSGQDYLPLTAGYLEAYARTHISRMGEYTFLQPIYKRLPVEDAVSYLSACDIAGFSAYTWNRNLSLAIARRLKEENPKCLIVFGGPEVPEQAEEFLRANPFIDCAVYGEGEIAFASLLEQYQPGRAWMHNVPSFRFIEGAYYCSTSLAPRMKDLSTLPSPYLTGLFDELMRNNPGTEWLAMWETDRGCPFGCTYCDWGVLGMGLVEFPLERVCKEFEWFGQHKITYIFCCNANFGIKKRDVEIAKYAGDVKKKYGLPRALSVQNAKNSEERVFQAQKTLADGNLNTGVTLAFESLNPPTLEAVKRKNIRIEDFRNLQRRFSQAGILTYTDFILGLPLETYNSFTNGISETIASGQHNRIQCGNLGIFPGAEMSIDAGYLERYGMETMETEAVIFHGVIDADPDRIKETQQLVVATNTMPREDWVRARAYAWMANFLHFDKLFQIPSVLLHEITGLSYRQIFEAFLGEQVEQYPVLRELKYFFLEKARGIQQGSIEYCPAPEWLNIYWPPDEYMFIKLLRAEKMGRFYSEAEDMVKTYLWHYPKIIDSALLTDSIMLNDCMVKKPFEDKDKLVACGSNIWEFYYGAITSNPIPLQKGSFEYHVGKTSEQWNSWDDWMRQVVWYGNKRGAYVYGVKPLHPGIAGHH